MLLEMHSHSSRYSRCSRIEPVALVQQVLKRGLQGIILTEHHYQWQPDELQQLREEAGVPAHFLIMAGQEVDTDSGHVLVYGGSRTIQERIDLTKLRDTFPDAALVWAHPFRKGKYPQEDRLCDLRFDAIEILSLNQSSRENYWGLTQWHKHRFTSTCGSDAHSREMAGIYPTQFDHPVTTINDVVREIRKGRCRPFIKEIPKAGSDMLVTEVTIGTKGDDEQRNRIIIKNISDPMRWQKTKASAELTARLHDDGFKQGVLRVPGIIEVDDNERLIIEEGQRGSSLYDILLTVAPTIGVQYFELTARWLARLHDLRLKVTGIDDLRQRELHRFSSYEEAFVLSSNTNRNEVQRLLTFLKRRENELIDGHSDSFVQCHGDYHPKNIIIGQDRMHDPSTVYVSVIDFNNSLFFAPAFDVGYFLAQFKSQFFAHPLLFEQYSDERFLDAYCKHAATPVSRKEFCELIDIFKIRAYMSIGAYFVRIGKGESREMEFIISEASALMDKYVST